MARAPSAPYEGLRRRLASAVRVAGLLTLLVTLSPPAGIAGIGVEPLYSRSHALLIAIDKYESRAWNDLRGAEEDIVEVARELGKQGFEIERVTGSEERPLTADKMTARIRRFLVERGDDPGARLLLWFAGHGATIGQEGFLVGVGAPSADDRDFPLHAVQMRDLASWVRLAKAKHVLAIFDTCFAGTIFESSRGGVRYAGSVAQMTSLPVRQFMTSGEAGQAASDDGEFRRSFLQAIRGETEADVNEDSYLTATELGVFLQNKISQLTRGRQVPQFGALRESDYNVGNFVFELPRGGTTEQAAVRGTTVPKGAATWVPVPFRDCEVCPEMLRVPAGAFRSGSPADEPGRGDGEEERRVVIDRAFAVGAYEVTFGEWDACVAEGGCGHRPDDAGWGRDRQPVMRVSWDDARAYLAWLSRKAGHDYRLPTESEWEYAARGHTSTAYWFGSRMEDGRANCSDCGRSTGSRTLPVGSFGRGGANEFGLYDVHGNVWEWTDDCWETPAVPESSALEPRDGPACDRRVVRGGSWANPARFARAAARLGIPHDERSTGIGLRVVRSMGP